ncbi:MULTISPECIES: sigma-70 family RNA polymerase sigma factor [unclassified Clostridium]|uniref:sigma-70 family RNA polymerase sigma factor n=1 Tax=unclassified Clostridium TaxID=2614128 RepID=UPI0011059A29|nr:MULTISPECIES: sigma-70 family RNA polymerase sigma factor [unclassified Clostridium]
MTTIYLKRYYPYLPKSEPLAVTDEIAVTLSIGGRLGNSYQRRKRDNDECSLEAVAGYEAQVCRPPLTPEEIVEGRELRAALYAAIAQLPPVQARRVYAHYIIGISKADLARADGVDRSVVCRSIERGLERLKNILEKSL